MYNCAATPPILNTPGNYATPSVAIIVLNWNNRVDTVACLQSIDRLEYPNYCPILVDNGSSDDTVEVVTNAFANVIVIRNPANLGYAEGNNVGISYAIQQDYEYVLVLNNDTELSPDILDIMVREGAQCPQTAAIAPKSFFYDEPDVIYFAGGNISRDGETVHRGLGQHDSPQFRVSGTSEWLSGCAILFRAQALKTIGLFDPRYYLLFEDTDWSLRARRLGFSLRLAATAKLWHKVSPSFGSTWSSSYTYYYTRNNLLFIESHFDRAQRMRLGYKALERIVRILNQQSQSLQPQERKSRWRAFGKGVTHFWLRRFGQQP